MSKSTWDWPRRKITFAREGLVPAVAGLACSVARDGEFTSTYLSKHIQFIHSNYLGIDFPLLEMTRYNSERKDHKIAPAGSSSPAAEIHGQSLRNLMNYWLEMGFIQHVGGKGRQANHAVTLKGAKYFMEQTVYCEPGHLDLRIDHLLLALFTIRATPLKILQDVYPELKSSWRPESFSGETHAGIVLNEIVWDWKAVRAAYISIIEMRRILLENKIHGLDQVNNCLTAAKKIQKNESVEATIEALESLPSGSSYLSMMGYAPFRSQRDSAWNRSARALANMFRMFNPSYVKHTIEDGLDFQSTTLYVPMVLHIGQIINTLRRLE